MKKIGQAIYALWQNQTKNIHNCHVLAHSLNLFDVHQVSIASLKPIGPDTFEKSLVDKMHSIDCAHPSLVRTGAGWKCDTAENLLMQPGGMLINNWLIVTTHPCLSCWSHSSMSLTCVGPPPVIQLDRALWWRSNKFVSFIKYTYIRQ